MKDFIKLIELSKNGNEEAMLEFIEDFTPLIKKYTKMMNNDEDFYNDMILKFISLIKSEIDLSKFRIVNNFVVLKYISVVISHHYILLSKKNNKKKIMEISCDFEAIVKLIQEKEPLTDYMQDIILLDTLRTILTEYEFFCIYYTLYQGFTSEELANYLNITKQAVNQCKNRALEKIKALY